MPRDREHFVLSGLGQSDAFKAKAGGSTKRPGDVADRSVHAQSLLKALDSLPDPTADGRPGLYLDVQGRPGEVMVTGGLNASDLTLLRFEPGRSDEGQSPKATVFATPKGLNSLRDKISDFAEKNRRKKDGSKGRPNNADLVQSISAIVEAGLRALWRSPEQAFPEGDGPATWEVWLEKSAAESFVAGASEYGVAVGSDRLDFPEDIVVIGTASRDALAMAVRRLTGVRALAAPTVTAEYFDAMEIEEQREWLAELQGRTTYVALQDPTYVTLLDRGVGRAHPLIAPALSVNDRHAANPAWGIEDFVGHGTQLAGLSLFGDMSVALQHTMPIQIAHRLESAKIIPDAGQNPQHLLGAMTRAGIDAVEAVAVRRRTFAMASTTEDDTVARAPRCRGG